MPLQEVTASADASDGTIFNVIYEHETYLLGSTSRDARDEWLEAIHGAVRALALAGPLLLSSHRCITPPPMPVTDPFPADFLQKREWSKDSSESAIMF